MLEDKQRELLTGSSRRVILNCTRQWGKSWMAAVALLFHSVHNPESLSIVAGPTLRQSAELLKKLKDLALRMGIKSQGDGINRQSLVLPNGSRIVAVPGNSPDGIRGFSGVTMFDEQSRGRSPGLDPLPGMPRIDECADPRCALSAELGPHGTLLVLKRD